MNAEFMTAQATTATPARNLIAWLERAVVADASDLHLVVGFSPSMRIHGEMIAIDSEPIVGAEMEQALRQVATAEQQAQFRSEKNLDFAFSFDHAGQPQRARINLFQTGADAGLCARLIRSAIPGSDWTGFPSDLADRLAHLRNGLVLITGVSGAGKSTTLAQIVNLLNSEGGYRIITVEEPVEYLFPRQPNSIVSQRQVGQDVHTFAEGLRYGLRQDPDVILVGEIRDRETAQMALSAAETGHLVFSTLHTRDAKGAISRFADLFPQSTQTEIRAQLALGLRAVISQHLLPSSLSGAKRELALEILFNNAPVASAIRNGKFESIDTNIVTGRSEGMISLDESLRRLLQEGRISRATAERFHSDQSLR